MLPNLPYRNFASLLTFCVTFVIASVFNCPQGFAQVFDSEQNRPTLRWRIIESENFQLLFPIEFERKAIEIARTLEEQRKTLSSFETFKSSEGFANREKPSKMPIIIQNKSVISNGFVQLAPRRAEFVTTPPQDSELSEWLGHLSLHELRHVHQFQDLVGKFRAPFFEQIGLALFGLHLPAWYFEGDAVWTETRFSEAGRGRASSWLMPFKANLLSGRQFSYEKDYLGSFKDITPGFYELGYAMVNKLYADFGEGMASNLMGNVSKNLLRPYSFNRALKKHTGFSTREWHAQTTTALLAEWSASQEGIYRDEQGSQVDEIALPTSKFPEHWLLPQIAEDGSLFVLRTGFGITPNISQIDSAGREIARPIPMGTQLHPHFAYAKNLLVWDELRVHPRYGKENYSIVVSYNLQNGRYTELSKRTRYFSPTLTAAGDRIACVEIDELNENHIVLLDPKDGNLVKRLSLKSLRLTGNAVKLNEERNLNLQTPAFNDDGSKLVVAAVSAKGRTLLEIDLKQETVEQLFPWSFLEIERPKYLSATEILFGCNREDDTNNIYVLNREKQAVQRLTNVRLGAFYPFANASKDSLWFSNYSVDGHKIARIALASRPALGYKAIQTNSEVLYVNDRQADAALDTAKISPSKPFRGLSRAFNFHSLSVTSGDFSSLDQLGLGIHWLSDNLLNTIQTRIGYRYESNERRSVYTAGLSYRKFYPIFDLSYSNRGGDGVVSRQVITIGPDKDTIRQIQHLGVDWRENVLVAQAQIPLLFYKRDRIYRATFSVGAQWSNRYKLGLDKERSWTPNARQLEQIEDRMFRNLRNPVIYAASFSQAKRRSRLDAGARWGQSLNIYYRHTPFAAGGTNAAAKSSHLAIHSAIFLPGWHRHHALAIQFNWQEGTGSYAGSNYMPLINGHGHLTPEPVRNNVLTHYRFPLAYPDWTLGSVAYVKRIRGGVFADFQNLGVEGGPKISSPRTLGLEIRSDINFFRYVLPNFDVGGRLIYVANDPKAQGKWLFTYGLSYNY